MTVLEKTTRGKSSHVAETGDRKLAPSAPPAAVSWPKTHSRHLELLAVVYVRQSTPQQVLNHRESTELQYKLSRRAQQLGWPPDRVMVIDEDLGQTAATAENRLGFQRLMAEVSLNHVGIVLGIEMSRLARSNKDWHQLLELCAIFDTLLADQNGLYDSADYNDRLLLGLTGIMNEAELHILRNRMMQGAACPVCLASGASQGTARSVDRACGELPAQPQAFAGRHHPACGVSGISGESLSEQHAVSLRRSSHRLSSGLHPGRGSIAPVRRSIELACGTCFPRAPITRNSTAESSWTSAAGSGGPTLDGPAPGAATMVLQIHPFRGRLINRPCLALLRGACLTEADAGSNPV